MQSSLRKSLIVSAFMLSAATIGPNASADPGDHIEWRSVIGIVQGNNIVGSGSGAATGTPGPWSAQGGRAKVDLDHGRIDFDIDGLVFAAGNSIGTTGTVAQVKGTLVCDTNGSASTPVGNSVIVDTPPVDLSEEGDAHFHGSVGALPAACLVEPDIAFLIRIVAGPVAGRWIANGTVLR